MGCFNSKQQIQKDVEPKYQGVTQKDTDMFNKQIQEVGNRTESNTASTENINKYYQFIKVLGAGAYGTVRLATLRSNTSETKHFAVKTIPQEAVKDQLNMLSRQLEILQQMDHPNIIKFYQIYHDEMYVHFVMEYCDGGDLYKRIKIKSSFSEADAAVIMKQTFNAVTYIHEMDIVHRDIKPDNIMFTSQKDGSQIKLIDFGLSKRFRKEDKKKPTMVGTPMYAAPQVIDEQNYDQMCDFWSLGVMMYFLISGTYPFKASDLDQLFKEISSAKIKFHGDDWEDVSTQAKDLIKHLMEKDPKKRYTAQQAQKHQWFELFEETQSNKDDISPPKLQKIQSQIAKLLESDDHQLMLRKQAVKILINHHMKEQEIENLKTTFQAIDQDGNGYLSFKEVQEVFKKLGLNASQEKLSSVFKQFSGNAGIFEPDNMKINYSQFIEGAMDLQSLLNKEQMWILFKQFDVANKLYIDKNDIQNRMARQGRQLSEALLNAMMEEVEAGHEQQTGKITFQDFQLIMKNDKKFIKDHEDESDQESV